MKQGSTSSGYGERTETYFPLNKGKTWNYRVSLTQEGRTAASAAVITSLPSRELLSKAVATQHMEVVGQRQLRFIVQDHAGIYEWANQPDGAPEPIIRETPNYFVKAPIKIGRPGLPSGKPPSSEDKLRSRRPRSSRARGRDGPGRHLQQVCQDHDHWPHGGGRADREGDTRGRGLRVVCAKRRLREGYLPGERQRAGTAEGDSYGADRISRVMGAQDCTIALSDSAPCSYLASFEATLHRILRRQHLAAASGQGCRSYHSPKVLRGRETPFASS
jgi:hypothetical protein